MTHTDPPPYYGIFHKFFLNPSLTKVLHHLFLNYQIVSALQAESAKNIFWLLQNRDLDTARLKARNIETELKLGTIFLIHCQIHN